METASLERSITRLPPSTGFDELVAAEPAPVAAPQPARANGIAAKPAAIKMRSFFFTTFLDCHERRGTPRQGSAGYSAIFEPWSAIRPSVTKGTVAMVYCV